MISGKYLTVTINGQILTGAQAWTATETSDQLDGTTGADQGYENDDDGIVRLEIDLELVQDLTTGVYIQIRSGTLLSGLALYRSSFNQVPAFFCPQAKVYRSANVGRVKDRFTVQCHARTKGPYVVNNPGAG